ncbi:MAG: DNA polymerase II, partial [Spirochaetota bacterium]
IRYVNPGLRPEDYHPRFTLLSIDIETGIGGELYSVALNGSGYGRELRKVLMQQGPGGSSRKTGDVDGELDFLPDERRLLLKFLEELTAWDPDILIGWNIIGFDLNFLLNKYRQHGLKFSAGRSGREPVIKQKQTGLLSAEIDGRLVIDGPQTLRAGFFSFDNYRLNTVAQAVLGRGKEITSDKEKVDEIERRFMEDKTALARYNLEDCLLVTEIFQKTGILDQLLTRSRITGMRMDKVSMSVATFDYFMLPRIHRKGYAAPDVADIVSIGQAPGGYVFTSEPGLYEHVLVFDFRSLYPSIIRTFHIDPYSRLKAGNDPVMTPAGIPFSQSEHILPDYIGELLERRSKALKTGDVHLSQSIKILMNSFYGVMGTPGSRFYHPDLPTAVTETGQWVLKEAAGYLRKKGYRVLYGDTDSLFVELKKHEANQADLRGLSLVKEINDCFGRRLKEEYNVTSYLELEYEKHYEKFFLPAMRGGEGGALKRYAGMIAGNGELEFKGMEVVRSDWTPLAKKFQHELFRRLFRGEELVQWIGRFVQNLRAGKYNDEIVYKRRLLRPAGEYVKNVPPHVRAARLLDPDGAKRIRSVEYVITLRGPIPVQLPHDDIDYKHYIEKQIRPLADGVLFIFNLNFDGIIKGTQLKLF